MIIIAEVLEVELTKLIEENDIREDIKRINQIAIVPKILEIICHTTGMGFAAVARVTEQIGLPVAYLTKFSSDLSLVMN